MGTDGTLNTSQKLKTESSIFVNGFCAAHNFSHTAPLITAGANCRDPLPSAGTS